MEFIIRQTVYLQRENRVLRYAQPMEYGDSGAHRWMVTIDKDGAEADLSAMSAKCYVTRAASDAERAKGMRSVTVIQDAEIDAQASTVSCVFDAACYGGVGAVAAIMRVSDAEGAAVTAAKMTACLNRSTSDAVFDPEDLVPSLDALLAQLEAMYAGTNAAQDAASAASAAARQANAAASAIDGMTVSATSGKSADASVSDKNGAKHIAFVLPKGDPGNTPYIGGNGNWWVGGEDTGTRAQGPAGQNGTGAGTVTAVKVGSTTHEPDASGVVDLGNITGGDDLSDSAPAALGTAAAGTSNLAARSDHVHKMPSASDVGALGKEDTAADSRKLGGMGASAYLKAKDADIKYAAKARYGKAVFFGDSLSVGSSNNDYSFVDVLSESGMFESVTKHAYGGATIGPYSRYSDANEYCLINQITRYETDIQNADIIFLEYGANDYSAVTAGNVWPGFDTHSATDTTICGYLKSALNAIQAINPKARLVWLAFTRWHGGLTDVQDKFSEDMLLYFEASVYRVVRSYHCGIMEIMAGYKGDEFFAGDGAHPNTEGHTLIAQNILANLFRNSEFSRLYKQVNFTVASDGTVTADSDRSLIYVLLETGAVDVSGMVSFDGSTIRHPLRCVIYNSDIIVFCGNTYDASYNQSIIEFSWSSSGVNYRTF